MNFTEIVGGTAVSLLMVVCLGIFVRLRQIETRQATAAERLNHLKEHEPDNDAAGGDCNSVQDNLIERVHALERELDAFRLHAAESYLRRDDYISAQSRVIGLLESHGAMLARLEERIGTPKA